MRGLIALAMIGFGGTVQADVTSARYAEPTTRYGHAILGDAIEYGALVMETSGGTVTVRLPETLVYEDVAPRLVDIDGDGVREVLVVESSLTDGARVAVIDHTGAVKAATPYIGQRNRWYAPVGVSDLDGDGLIEVAYVDRPHLAKVLRVWRYDDGDFTEVANLPGVTNHRIGETDIAGGIRDCGDGPELVVASAQWGELLAVSYGDGFDVRVIGARTTRADFAAALACEE